MGLSINRNRFLSSNFKARISFLRVRPGRVEDRSQFGVVCFVLLVKCEAPTNKECVEFIQYNGSREGECVARRARRAKCDCFDVQDLESYVCVGENARGTITKAIHTQRRLRSSCFFPMVVSDRLVVVS